MKNIPDDYYLKYLDPKVHIETLEFHAKGNYTLHDAFKNTTCLHTLDDAQLSTLTGNELRFYPDMDLSIVIEEPSDFGDELGRNESCESFTHDPIDFSTIKNLVKPLLSKNSDSHKRGYPSGGALYPIEIFICSLMRSTNNWPFPDRFLHLLPHSGKFEVMQKKLTSEEIEQAILCTPANIGTPSVAIIYTAYLPKTLFKYRYRGYRLALMEAGSLYMLLELRAKQLGLRCRLWSAYTDTLLNKAMGLNPALFSPLCVHFIGAAHESV